MKYVFRLHVLYSNGRPPIQDNFHSRSESLKYNAAHTAYSSFILLYVYAYTHKVGTGCQCPLPPNRTNVRSGRGTTVPYVHVQYIIWQLSEAGLFGRALKIQSSHGPLPPAGTPPSELAL
jgi:hypothetical protein